MQALWEKCLDFTCTYWNWVILCFVVFWIISDVTISNKLHLELGLNSFRIFTKDFCTDRFLDFVILSSKRLLTTALIKIYSDLECKIQSIRFLKLVESQKNPLTWMIWRERKFPRHKIVWQVHAIVSLQT